MTFFVLTGIVLVTDAIAPLGLKPGRYKLGDQDVDVTSNCAVLTGTTTLCGAIAPMDQCVRHLKSATGTNLLIFAYFSFLSDSFGDRYKITRTLDNKFLKLIRNFVT